MSLLAISLLPCIAGLLRLYYVELSYDSVDELCKHTSECITDIELTRDVRER